MKLQLIEFAYIALFLVAAFGLSYIVILCRRSRIKEIVQGWAQSKGFEVIRIEEKFLAAGPFGFTILGRGGSQVICKVSVRKENDPMPKTVWLLCGGYFTGLMSSDVEAQFDCNDNGELQ